MIWKLSPIVFLSGMLFLNLNITGAATDQKFVPIQPGKGPSHALVTNGGGLGWYHDFAQTNGIKDPRHLGLGTKFVFKERYKTKPSAEEAQKSRRLLALDRRSNKAGRRGGLIARPVTPAKIKQLQENLASSNNTVAKLKKENDVLKGQVGSLTDQLTAEQKKNSDLSAQFQAQIQKSAASQVTGRLIALWILLGLTTGTVGMWLWKFLSDKRFTKYQNELVERALNGEQISFTDPIIVVTGGDPGKREMQYMCRGCFPKRVVYVAKQNLRSHLNSADHADLRRVDLGKSKPNLNPAS